LQSHHISGCNHTVKDVATTCIFTRLQPHQANTNLVAIWQCHGMELFELGFCNRTLPVFCNCFFAIAVTCCFLQLFFCNHTAIRLQSHKRDKVAITHMLVSATAFLQSQHISGCNHTLTYFTITRIFTRLQQH
jgi:hypothetical protein